MARAALFPELSANGSASTNQVAIGAFEPTPVRRAAGDGRPGLGARLLGEAPPWRPGVAGRRPGGRGALSFHRADAGERCLHRLPGAGRAQTGGGHRRADADVAPEHARAGARAVRPGRHLRARRAPVRSRGRRPRRLARAGAARARATRARARPARGPDAVRRAVGPGSGHRGGTGPGTGLHSRRPCSGAGPTSGRRSVPTPRRWRASERLRPPASRRSASRATTAASPPTPAISSPTTPRSINSRAASGCRSSPAAGCANQARAAQARSEQARLQFEGSVLQAFREANDALVAVRTSRDQRAAQAEPGGGAPAGSRSWPSCGTAAESRAISRCSTPNADCSRAELGLSQAQLLELSSVVELFRALGGSWN